MPAFATQFLEAVCAALEFVFVPTRVYIDRFMVGRLRGKVDGVLRHRDADALSEEARCYLNVMCNLLGLTNHSITKYAGVMATNF